MHAFLRLLVTLSLTITVSVSADHMSKKTINKRTAPVGQVLVSGTPEAEVATAESEVAAARTAETIYNNLCMACHATGLANAPLAGKPEVWEKLMERGIDELVNSAKTGLNAMPPMGTCADCTDEELKETILYMAEMGK